MCDRTDRFSETDIAAAVSDTEASAIHAAPCLQLLGLGFLALAIVQVSTGALQGMGKQLILCEICFWE